MVRHNEGARHMVATTTNNTVNNNTNTTTTRRHCGAAPPSWWMILMRQHKYTSTIDTLMISWGILTTRRVGGWIVLRLLEIRYWLGPLRHNAGTLVTQV